MKLATLKDSTRDGRLVVVSRDLTRCSEVGHIARTLQAALDDWAHAGPRLARVAEGIETGSQPTMRFHEHEAASPLPRAYQWADGSAYVNHVELVRKARNAEMPASFWTDPLMYQGGSDSFLGPRDPIVVADEAYGIDMEGEIAVIVDDVAMGASVEDARAAIRLVMLVNDVSLRGLIPAELAKGFGFFQSKPSSAFSPVARRRTSSGSSTVTRNETMAMPARARAQYRATASQPKASITNGAANLVTAAPILPAPKMPSAVPWRSFEKNLET